MTDSNIDLLFPPIANDLDGTVFLLLIECAELPLLLPVVEGAYEDNNRNGNDDRDTFHEVDTRGFTEARRVIATGFGGVLHADVLVDPERQGNDSSDTEDNLRK